MLTSFVQILRVVLVMPYVDRVWIEVRFPVSSLDQLPVDWMFILLAVLNGMSSRAS